MVRLISALFLACLALSFAGPVVAEDEAIVEAFARKVSKPKEPTDKKDAAPSYPSVTGLLEVNVENDLYYKATPKANRLNDLYTKSEASLGLHLDSALSLQTAFKYEPQRTPNVHSRVFEDEGLWVDRLFVDYQRRGWSAYVGKIHPTFSIGYDRAPGIFGNDYAKDYELKEKLGFGLGRKFETEAFGAHEVLFELFQSDRSALGRSYFRHAKRRDNNMARQDHPTERDGGLSNDGRFDSYVVALNGDFGQAAPNLVYHLAYRRLGAGLGQTTAEHGTVGALQYGAELAKDVKLKPFVEAAKLRHTLATVPQGAFERDALYLTSGFELGWTEWFWAFSRTGRNFDTNNSNANVETHDRLVATSIGYRFDFGLVTEIGWKDDRGGGTNTKSLGARIGYALEF